MIGNSIWMEQQATLTQLHCSVPSEALAALSFIGRLYVDDAIYWQNIRVNVRQMKKKQDYRSGLD